MEAENWTCSSETTLDKTLGSWVAPSVSLDLCRGVSRWAATAQGESCSLDLKLASGWMICNLIPFLCLAAEQGKFWGKQFTFYFGENNSPSLRNSTHLERGIQAWTICWFTEASKLTGCCVYVEWTDLACTPAKPWYDWKKTEKYSHILSIEGKHSALAFISNYLMNNKNSHWGFIDRWEVINF